MYVAFVTIKCKSADFNMNNRFFLEFEASADTVLDGLKSAIVAWLVKFNFSPIHMSVEVHDVFEASRVGDDFYGVGSDAVSAFGKVYYKRGP